MGDPDFDLGERKEESALQKLALKGPSREGQARRSVELRGLQFSRLPGTREEVLAIRELFGKNETESYLGEEALEEVLRVRGHAAAAPPGHPRLFPGRCQAPRGFRDRGVHGRPGAGGGRGARFPLRRRLPDRRAGSRTRCCAPASPLPARTAPWPGAEDAAGSEGIVTAEKILGLKLWGTEMVVLSACETGLGEVRTGEGVSWAAPGVHPGRGQERGHEHVVRAGCGDQGVDDRVLPRAPDRVRLNRCQALRQAALKQMAVVKQRYGDPHPFYWGAFVFMGEP
ncbi:MAG: CHAT domain-containing protein [Desulfobacterales bacterium]|nr:CHAT domain-containing protein [Desulfobacterales bacterium]